MNELMSSVKIYTKQLNSRGLHLAAAVMEKLAECYELLETENKRLEGELAILKVDAVKPLGLKVTPQGIRFGNAWFSHEKITGHSAEQLNNGSCGITVNEYLRWVQAILEKQP